MKRNENLLNILLTKSEAEKLKDEAVKRKMTLTAYVEAAWYRYKDTKPPKKEKKEKRTRQVAINCDMEAKKEITERAKQEGLSYGDFILKITSKLKKEGN